MSYFLCAINFKAGYPLVKKFKISYKNFNAEFQFIKIQNKTYVCFIEKFEFKLFNFLSLFFVFFFKKKYFEGNERRNSRYIHHRNFPSQILADRIRIYLIPYESSYNGARMALDFCTCGKIF